MALRWYLINLTAVYSKRLEAGVSYPISNNSTFEADWENPSRLESEHRVTIEWFEDNYKQLNKDKCRFLLHENSVVCFGNKFLNACEI